MKTHLFYGLAIFALILFIIFQVKQSEKQKYERLEDNRRAQETIAKHIARAKTAGDSARVERVKRIQRDSIAKAREMGLKMRVAAYAKKLETLRVPVQPLIDSLQELGLFVDAYDSLSNAKDSVILSQGQRIEFIELSHAREVGHLNQQIAENDSTITGSINRVSDLEKSLAKAEKKASKRWSAGVTGGYGVMSTGGEVRTGPVVSAGVSFRLFRF